MEAHKEELDENESKVCFCNLRNLREENSQSLVQASADNLCALAESKLAGVLRAICKYRQSIHKVEILPDFCDLEHVPVRFQGEQETS
uniref:Uncharacterized protein n=1 Tax=Sphaerodactylus townsendi TaxID=933632 RepID=A0ACB8E9L9_9SAUR